MAIMKMKKVAFIGPADMRDALLGILQDAAVVDANSLVESVETPGELMSRRLNLQRIVRVLEQIRKEAKDTAPELTDQTDRELGEATVREVESLLARRTELDNRLALLRKDYQQIYPWGHIDPGDLELLRSHGLHLDLYEVTAKQARNMEMAGARWFETIPLRKTGRALGLVVAALERPAEVGGLEPVTLPAISLAQLESEMAQVEADGLEIGQTLLQLSARLPAIRRLERFIEDQLAYAKVRAGLGGDKEIFALSGWCPVDRVDEVENLASGRPVVLVLSDPGPEDEVPVALKNGRMVRLFEPLLRAFNIPHYRELDPTVFMTPFMAVFFGFCLGDMGYGLVLIALASVVLKRFELKGELKTAFKLLAVLGVSATVIGGALGSFFGIKLYAENLLNLPTNWLLFTLNEDPTVFFYTSLVFGMVQLSVGMAIRLVRQIVLEQWQQAVGTAGWLLLMPSIGLGVWLGTAWIPIACGGLILLFASPSRSVLRRLGGGAWALYNISGLFGDVMSYARIFGLGLSSGIIAMVVNIIAMSVAHGTPVIGWIFAVIILVVGHTFNFAMSMIGSVVHPARLQFLEFFGKFFEGGGRPYSPFRKVEGE